MIYIGRKYNLYPTDPDQAYVVDSCLDQLKQLMEKVYKNYFNPNEEQKKATGEQIIAVDFPQVCKAFNNRLEKNGQKEFIAGTQTTIADIGIGVVSADWYDEKNPASPALQAVVTKFPLFKDYVENL